MLDSTLMREVCMMSSPFAHDNWHRCQSQIPQKTRLHRRFKLFLLLCASFLFNFGFDTSVNLICSIRAEPQRRCLTRYSEEGQKQKKQSGVVHYLECSMMAPVRNRLQCDMN